MAIELGTVTLYGLIALIINGVLMWIREWRKHRTWSENGDDLKEIKEDVKSVDGKVGETNIAIAGIETAVNAQKTQCSATVKRFDKAISDQNKTLIDLAGRKR